MKAYDHKDIEAKWQKEWEANGTYKTASDSTKPKQYILDMFPYPSGEGLHVGHPRGYIATDVYSRKKRMEGFNVLHPMGWDAFGLPAENYAIKNQVHPRIAVEQNVKRFKEQLSLIGLDYDWSREVNTTDPDFYKWTQWVFLQLYKKGLAYESNEPVNWCPTDKTVLANEDVEPDGTCERCGTKVEKKPMRQWVLKITDYADRMLADLDKLPKWPEGVKEAQRNWIGRTEGAEIDFSIGGQDHPIKIFTTRPDTIYGATFIGVSAGLAKDWMGMGWKASPEIVNYIEQTLAEEAVRDFKEKEKTGIYAGFDAINPASKEKVPVWITNYVMKDVGTGAIMGVPAHDERDFEFARKYHLSIKDVIAQVVGERNSDAKERDRVCAIIEKDGKILCEKVHDDTTKFLGNFILIGGGIEKEETPESAVIREVEEEVGIKNANLTEKIGVFRASWFSKRRETFRTMLHHAFVVSIDYSEIKQNTKEAELAWVDIEELIKQFKKSGDIDQALILERYQNKKSKFFSDHGELINSDKFNGLTSQEAKTKITEFVSGKMVSTYRIKDWVFSRQRYWGEPIPMIHCETCGVVPVPEDQLPVLLPDVSNYEPTGTGESPLADIAEWVNTTCPTCGGTAKRETNTMPQWAGSSWYYLRYIDPANGNALIDPTKEKGWMPVDVYVGGDHATRHLIYARFWHKFLFDIGVVSTEEPFPRLEFLGFILAEDGRKMSKRWGNIVNPDDVIKQFGADAFRLYEMFIGPFEGTVPWSTNGLVGTYRFLERFFHMFQIIKYAGFSENKTDIKIKISLEKTIKKISEDIEKFKFNTAISSLMIFVNGIDVSGEKFDENSLSGTTVISKEDLKRFIKLLAPFAPHMTEELWHELGETSSIHLSEWPSADPALLVDDTVTIGVQINGKVRDELTILVSSTKEDIQTAALALPRIKEYIEGKTIQTVIVVPGRIINIVVI